MYRFATNVNWQNASDEAQSSYELTRVSVIISGNSPNFLSRKATKSLNIVYNGNNKWCALSLSPSLSYSQINNNLWKSATRFKFIRAGSFSSLAHWTPINDLLVLRGSLEVSSKRDVAGSQSQNCLEGHSQYQHIYCKTFIIIIFS